MSYCIKCDKSNADTAKFCTSCGGVLSSNSIKTAASKKKFNWLLYGGITLTLLLATAYFVFLNRPQKQKDILVNENVRSAIKELVYDWNTGLNNANVSSVSSMYAERIVYYRQAMSKGNAAVILSDFFQKNPYFSQQITSEITIDKASNDLVIAAFDKTVSMNGKTNVYPSYLKFSKENNDWKIVEEGDKITDYNINKNK